MKKRGMWMVVSVLVVLGLILASCGKAPEAPTAPTAPTTTAKPGAPTSPTAPAPAQKEVIKLLTQARGPQPPIVGPNSGGLRFPDFPDGVATWWLLDLVERYSGGRIEFEVAPYDSIVLWTEILPGVSRGAVDLELGLLHGTAAGIIPEADILNGLPLQWNDFTEAMDGMYNWGILDEVQPLFEKENVHVIPYMGGSYNVLGIKGDVRKLADIKAKKIRAVGAMNTLMSALGATALIIPYSEGYMALKLGTIDGWVAAPTAVSWSYKFYETSKPYTIVYKPRLGSWTNSWAINLDVWNSLPPDLQDMLTELVPMAHTYYAGMVGSKWADAVGIYLEGLTNGDTQVVEWSAEDQATVTQTAYKQWDSVYGKKSANMARLVEIAKKQVAALGRPFPGYKPGW